MIEVEWSRLKAHELRDLANRKAVVILPVAAIEQHGPHLPVMTDTRIGGEVAARAARTAFDKRPTIVAPVVWSGLSEHHMPYGGTLTLDLDTFLGVLRCLIRSVTRHGFTDVLISNSHGGNIRASEVAADQLAQETGATIVSTTYASEAKTAIGSILDDQPGVMHAWRGGNRDDDGAGGRSRGRLRSRRPWPPSGAREFSERGRRRRIAGARSST